MFHCFKFFDHYFSTRMITINTKKNMSFRKKIEKEKSKNRLYNIIRPNSSVCSDIR